MDGGSWGAISVHLTELRARVILVLLTWLALGILGWQVHPQVLDWVFMRTCGRLAVATSAPAMGSPSCALVSHTLLGGFWARLWAAGLPVVIIGVPIAVWQAGWFACGPEAAQSRTTMRRIRVSGWLLLLSWGFSIGVTAALIDPAIGLLLSLGQPWIVPLITPEGIVSVVVGIFLAVAGMVLLPGLVWAALSWHLITPTQLRQARRPVIMGVLVIAAILTPTGDPITMLVVAAWPIVVIGLLTHWYSWRLALAHQPLPSSGIRTPKLA